mgnify:CR=1 FL=1
MSNKKYNPIEVYEDHYNDPIMIAPKSKQAEYFVIKTKINPSKGSMVFEPGCGIGTLGSYLMNKFKVNVYGMELSKTAIKMAKSNGIRMKKGDLNNRWPYKSKFFDYVINLQVIEHILNTDNFIKESKRILKKDGLLYISTPNLASWFNRIIFLFGYQPFFTEISNEDKTLGLKFTQSLTLNRTPLGHIRVFTLKGLIDLLEYHGFVIVNKYGGEIKYLPDFMSPFDKFFSNFPSLASDLFIIAKKK